jgi:DNA-binding NarL/FixJ family response regulator
MRRVNQNETFHGTGAGQTPTDQELMRAHGLSERQAQCASLLRNGVAPSDIPETLGITVSTAEKHIAALRDKTGQGTTSQLCAFLNKRNSRRDGESFHWWQPVLPPEAHLGGTAHPFAEQLQDSTTLLQMLSHFRDHLADLEVAHVYFAFVPLSVRGFMVNDLWDIFFAPDTLSEVFTASGGLMSQPMALQLFNNPGDLAYTSYDDKSLSALPTNAKAFGTACRDHGAKCAMGFGFPVSAGFTGFALTLKRAMTSDELITKAPEVRAAGMLLQGYAHTNGALAALADLTVRERDALSALARGCENKDAATEMKISPRAFSKLVAQARKKLKSKTTGEAIYKASALNALVFL